MRLSYVKNKKFGSKKGKYGRGATANISMLAISNPKDVFAGPNI